MRKAAARNSADSHTVGTAVRRDVFSAADVNADMPLAPDRRPNGCLPDGRDGKYRIRCVMIALRIAKDACPPRNQTTAIYTNLPDFRRVALPDQRPKKDSQPVIRLLRQHLALHAINIRRANLSSRKCNQFMPRHSASPFSCVTSCVMLFLCCVPK